MQIPTKLFGTTTDEEKIEFFLKCQEILIQHHPESDFIIRESNYKERLSYASDLIKKYKGLCYMDDNICVLFNFVRFTEQDAVTIIKEHMFKPPVDDYNAVVIDFVVFRHLQDCALWVQSRYDPQIEYVVYVKNGKPQIYKTKELLARVLKTFKPV